MRPTHPRSFRAQASFLRRQFLQDGGLPFTDVLTDAVLTDALAAVGGWLDRIFSPLVTLRVFLGQVLSADHSCRAAVARLNPARICTSHVERKNLTIRLQGRRMTRLTNAFSKKWDNYRAALALWFVYYNFCRPHQTLTEATREEGRSPCRRRPRWRPGSKITRERWRSCWRNQH